MLARQRMSGTGLRHKLAKWMAHQQMRIKFLVKVTNRMELDRLYHPSATSRPRVTHKDNMRSNNPAWFIHKETVRWQITLTTRTRLTVNQAKSINSVSIRKVHGRRSSAVFQLRISDRCDYCLH